jgi:hypothetical protein
MAVDKSLEDGQLSMWEIKLKQATRYCDFNPSVIHYLPSLARGKDRLDAKANVR